MLSLPLKQKTIKTIALICRNLIWEREYKTRIRNNGVKEVKHTEIEYTTTFIGYIILGYKTWIYPFAGNKNILYHFGNSRLFPFSACDTIIVEKMKNFKKCPICKSKIPKEIRLLLLTNNL